MRRPSLARARVPALAALLLLLAACGGADGGAASGGDTAAAAGASADDATPADAPTDGQPFAFTAADLDALERGLARETELVREAQERASAATTPEARGAAAQAQWKEQTMPEGARAAGLSPERYAQVRETVLGVLQTLDFQGAIDGPLSIDTARASPEMRQRLARDPLAELAPASAEALRGRLDRLAPLWARYMELTAVAG